MPPPLECGAGPARGRAGDGRLGSHGPPRAYGLPGSGASRAGTGGATPGRPKASGLHWPRPGHAPRPAPAWRPLPALATPLQPTSSSANPAGAGQEVPGQSRRLPLGASRSLRTWGSRAWHSPAQSTPDLAGWELAARPLDVWSSRRSPPHTVEKGGWTPPKCWSLSPSSTSPRPPLPHHHQELSPEPPLL